MTGSGAINAAQSPASEQRLRILYIAYPLLQVSENSAGGAEQVLWTLEREMHARGHHTAVAACSGSQVAGELFATGDPAETLDQFEIRSRQQTRLIRDWLLGSAAHFDLIHDMSGAFWQHVDELRFPILATLHLPRKLYKDVSFSLIPKFVSFNCVSDSQTAEFQELPRMLGAIPNGIALDRFPSTLIPSDKREYLLWLGRICEEKGTHTALDVAHQAGKRLIIAGAVYPFLYHQKYFAREVIPRLKRAGNQAKYIERPSFAEKIDFLRNAQALLITSEINETSSLVAMEAAACGTPVIALRRGALAEVIAEGITGLLAEDAEEMISASSNVFDIDERQCRVYAEHRYSSAKMADGYESLYRQVRMRGVPIA